jgi:hypothetical protein
MTDSSDADATGQQQGCNCVNLVMLLFQIAGVGMGFGWGLKHGWHLKHGWLYSVGGAVGGLVAATIAALVLVIVTGWIAIAGLWWEERQKKRTPSS